MIRTQAGGLGQTGSWLPRLKIKARCIEPMLLHRTEMLPQGGSELYELFPRNTLDMVNLARVEAEKGWILCVER